MARPKGLEPLTAGLEIRCSIRLSYGRSLQKTINTIFAKPIAALVQPRAGSTIARPPRAPAQ